MKKNTGKKDELIHVKLEYDELIQAKRDFLSLQRDFLRLIKFLKRYHAVRTDELNRKTLMNKKFRQLNINVRSLQKILPRLEVPKILNKEEDVDVEEFETPGFSSAPSDRSIEKELEDIQGRLDSF